MKKIILIACIVLSSYSYSQCAPTTGITSFSFGTDVGLANGDGSTTASASDVGGTCWDVTTNMVSGNSSANIIRGGDNEGISGSAAILYFNVFTACSAMTFTSNDGSEFDLTSFAVNSTQGDTDYTVTGSRDGSLVTGASFSGSLTQSALGGAFTTIDISSDDDFNNIDSFTITFNSPQLRFIFDDIIILAPIDCSSTPSDETFGTFVDNDYLDETVIYQCFTYEASTSNRAGIGNNTTDGISSNTTLFTGSALLIYGEVEGGYGEFKSTSNTNNFKLNSLNAEFFDNDGGVAENYNIVGFDDGVEVVRVNSLNVTSSTTIGSGASTVTWTRADFDTDGSNSGTLTFGTGFQNIDQVRFEIAAGDAVNYLYVGIDNIDFADAVVDATAPVFSLVSPSSSSTVANANVGYTLSEAIESGTVTFTQTGGTADGSSPHVVNLTGSELNIGGRASAALTNAPTLVSGAIYTISFDGTDGAGNTATTVSVTNITFDSAAPTVSSSNPADGATGIDPAADITVTFSEDIAFGTGFFQIRQSSDDAAIFSIDAANPAATSNVASISGAVLIINPSASLSTSTEYYLFIPAGTPFLDLAGNAFTGFTAKTDLNFTILTPNSAPSFTIGANQTVSQSEGAQTIVGHSTAMTDNDGSTQTLTFNISNDNNDIFNVQPDIDEATGNLTFTPKSSTFGKATVTVSLSDDGGTVSGGVDQSADQTFDIFITPDNIKINEVHALAGSDVEFIEVYDTNGGSTSLSGLVMVWFNGGDDLAYKDFNLTGSTSSSGFYVIGENAFASKDQGWGSTILQNGPDAVAIYVGSAADFSGASAPTIDGLVDVIVYGSSDDAALRVALGNPALQVTGNSANSISRFPDGTGGYVAQAATAQATNDVTSPTITAVSIPNSTAKIGDAVTVSITAGEAGLSFNTGTVNGVVVTGFSDDGGGNYSATYTIEEGNTDRAAGDDIPVNFTLDDTAGNSSVAFTTAISQNADTIDANSPTIVSSSPADNDTDVGIAGDITITFNENIAFGTGSIQIIDLTDGSNSVTIDAASPGSQASISGAVLTLSPTNALDLNSNYAIQLPSTAIDDVVGNSFAGILDNTTFNFTTINAMIAFSNSSSNGAESISSANLQVTLNTISGVDVSVDYTVAGTATGSGVDYTLADGTLTITAGNISNDITIASIVADAILEANETLIVTLSNPVNGTLGTNTSHTYTITNDDSASVTIADVSGNENDGSITVIATLDNAVQGGFTIDVSTANGTATTADSDYTAVTSETLTFTGNAGETQTFTVTPTGDTKLESNETLTLSQSNLAATTLAVNITDGATATIINDDSASVTIADVSGNEDDGNITVTATLDNAVQGGFTIDVSTADETATAADSDYTAVISETLTFTGNAGETQTFALTPTGDTKLELNETLTISQSNLAATTLSIDISDGATVTITNDDFEAIVITNDASSVTSTTVNLGGEVTNEGSTSVTERGIVYSVTSENNNPQIGGANVIKDNNGVGLGVFNEIISGLVANTQYSYVAYAKNNQGTTYGALKIFTTATLVLNEISFSDLIKLYPNPVKNTLYVKSNSVNIGKITLYDVLGKTINNVEFKNDSIDITNLKSGVYMIKIKTEKGVVVKKIIKN